HGDSRDDSHREVDRENLPPETSGPMVALVTLAQRDRFQDHDQQRQSHRELRKQVVKCNREREMEAMKQKRRIHDLDDMLERPMKLVAALVLLSGLSPAQPSRALEQRVIAAAKQVDVSKLDVKLSRMRFDAWLQKQIGSVPITWESN